MNIGGVIKRRRQKRNMTQAELGELLNVTPQAVSRWEMGISYPDIVIVPEISKALAVSADELLGISRPSEIDYGREAEQMTDRDGGAWPEPEGGKYADPILTQSQVDSIFDYMPCSATGKGRRVLITDDAEFLRTVVQGILSSKGHTVLQAKNGQECLEILRREAVDVCLLDIVMPVMDGVETLRRIREEKPELRVIMLSAMARESIVRQALQSGADAFVVKPFHEECLIERIG